MVVTQEVEDILSSPVVKEAVINNADCKILLDQRKYQHRFETIQAFLGLTDKERALVLSVNKGGESGGRYKEVFISLGGNAKVYRTEVSPEEYLAYTTEESEKVKVSQSISRYGMQQGIEVLAQEMREKEGSHG
jgi:hypothetical protein